MIKIFLKHLIYEKCINIIFDGITKAFTKPVRLYEILSIEGMKENGFYKRVYTIKYNGELHKMVVGQSENMREILGEVHGLTPDEVDRELNNVIMTVIENQIQSIENGSDKTIEDMIKNKSDDRDTVIVDHGNGDIEEVDFDSLPPEIQKEL